MKKRNLFFGLVCFGALVLSACGGEKTPASSAASSGSGSEPASSESTSSEQSSSSSEQHVHNYEFSQFIWTKTPGAYTAVARYVCAADEAYQDHDAVVTKNTTEAQCEADGQNVWHAEYDGHSDDQYETLPALGHQWGAPVWQWSGLFATATATFTCTRNPEHTHQEVATKENGGIVLHAHEDATCELDGYDRYRATVTFEGQTYTDDRDDVIPAYEHSDVDIHGFCELCGQYQGTELNDPDMNTEFATLPAGQYYYRFIVNDEVLYKKVVHNIPASEVMLFGLRNTTWETISLSTGSFSAIEDTDDGYVYVLLNITATSSDVYFRFDIECAHNHIDEYGFCTVCEQYIGQTIAQSQWDTEVALDRNYDGDETLFLRIAIDDEHHFTIIQDTNWIQAFEDDYGFYLKSGDTFTKILPSEFDGMYSQAIKYRTHANDFFSLGGRPSDGYLYFVGVVGGQESLSTADKLTVSTEHNMNTGTGFCYAGEYMGTEIPIGVTQIVKNIAKNEKRYFRFEDPGDVKLKRDYNSPLQSGDFAFYRMDNEGQLVAITMDGTLRNHESSSDGYYYLIITAGAAFDSGSFRITMEKVLTVAFYAKFVNAERISAMSTAIETHFETNGDCDRVLFVTLGDDNTNVSAFAGLIGTYNGDNPYTDIDIFLGANGDSGDKELAALGYQKESETSYQYGTKSGNINNRKLWCKTGQTADANVVAMKAYLAANWAV